LLARRTVHGHLVAREQVAVRVFGRNLSADRLLVEREDPSRLAGGDLEPGDELTLVRRELYVASWLEASTAIRAAHALNVGDMLGDEALDDRTLLAGRVHDLVHH